MKKRRRTTLEKDVDEHVKNLASIGVYITKEESMRQHLGIRESFRKVIQDTFRHALSATFEQELRRP
jgi:hypothetical protein